MNRVRHATDREVLTRVRCFMRRLVNSESLPTILEHLGHKRKCGNALIRVQSGQNLFSTSDFDPFTNAKIQGRVSSTHVHCLSLVGQ